MRCRRAGKISPRVGKQAEPSLAAGKEQFIDQLDGNASLKSQNLEDDDKDEFEHLVENQEESENEERIETIVGNRPEKVVGEVQRPPARKVIKRDEGLVQALSLPSVSLYDMRSIWSKFNNLADDINMRETDLCFLTEV